MDCPKVGGWCGVVCVGGGVMPQWVRFASPQSAPTMPATTVFIALIVWGGGGAHLDIELTWVAFMFKGTKTPKYSHAQKCIVH